VRNAEIFFGWCPENTRKGPCLREKPRAKVIEWRITLRTVPCLHDMGMTVSIVDII